MTINQLHKLTAKLIEQGAGRRSVCIDKSTFTHPLEPDGCKILPVEIAELKSYEIMDDDGGMTDKSQVSLVLFGNEERDERILKERRIPESARNY